jgi:hypothetical protein
LFNELYISLRIFLLPPSLSCGEGAVSTSKLQKESSPQNQNSNIPHPWLIRTIGSSVSNQGPLVAGRQGLFFGHCVQLMMSIYTAVQDAHKPNGSINGIDETGRIWVLIISEQHLKKN